MEIACTLIGMFFVMIGVICIYDARKITKSRFSFQDINEGTKYLKVFGVIVAILGLGIMYYYIPSSIEILKEIR